MTPPGPVNPVMVLANGIRVPLALRYLGYSVGTIGHCYRPVIEGDVDKLMPQMVAIDADEWPSNTTIKFPGWSGGTPQWAQQILDNSPILKGGSNISRWGFKVDK
jgi:hypothetical protein